MSKIKHLAAIDVGSNAIRFILGEVGPGGKLQTIVKVREPVRLGGDVFTNGEISAENMQKSLAAFKKFRKEMENYDITKVRAVATSAVREAKNGKGFAKSIYSETGINLEIIDHNMEAKIIQTAVSSKIVTEHRRMVIMDIGGGSIEYIYSDAGAIKKVKSYPYGTVRCLQRVKNLESRNIQIIIDEAKQEFSKFKQKVPGQIHLFVGTGGNLVCLGVLRVLILGKKNNSKLRLSELNKIITNLEELGNQGRLEKLGMKKDRADVILPAAYITRMSMEVLECNMMLIPKVGLRDGLLLGQNS